jgi:acetolactate synthase-1/3 small subunit
MGHVISLLVENKAGVLSRIVGLFSQRGYNIESLNVAPALDAEVSRITLTTRTDPKGIEQVVKQLNKLIDVVKVTPYDSDTQIIREMALVRVKVSEANRAEVLALSEVFRARVIDVSSQNYIFELTGQSGKIDAFLENVEAYGIREVHRTGELTLGRGKGGLPKDASGRRRPLLVENETD